MPKIEIKESTLNGQAFIIKYCERSFFYLRINRGNKRYTNISLNTAELTQAHKNALSAYVKAENEPPMTKSRKLRFEKICEEYLSEKEDEVRRGQLRPRSQNLYQQRVYQRIIPYCNIKGIKCISDICKTSFADYGGYYLDIKTKGKWKTETAGLSAGTINSDITTIKSILNWMVEKELLDPKKKPELKKLRDLKNYRDEANPAFLPDDWEKFKSELYKIENDIDDPETAWKRRWFIQWVSFQHGSGCRPHETAQIRIGDCEQPINRKDGKLSGVVRISNTTKTGGRDVAMNGHTVRKIRTHLNKGIKIRNEQIKAHNQRILESAQGDIKKKECPGCLPLIPAASNDDLLMMNPFFSERTVYHMEHIRQWFNRVLEKCEFERRYTLYSLRSTHISFALVKGQRVDLIAKNCGTSLAMIQKTYDGLSSRFHVDSLGFFKDVQLKDKDDMLLPSK